MKNGYYTTLKISSINKFKKLIIHMRLNNIIITLFSLIYVFLKILYFSVVSYFFEKNEKQFLKKEYRLKLKNNQI